MTRKGRNSFCGRAVPRQGAVLGPTGDVVREEAGEGQGELNPERFSRDGRVVLGSAPEAATKRKVRVSAVAQKHCHPGKQDSSITSLSAKPVSSEPSTSTVPGTTSCLI